MQIKITSIYNKHTITKIITKDYKMKCIIQTNILLNTKSNPMYFEDVTAFRSYLNSHPITADRYEQQKYVQQFGTKKIPRAYDNILMKCGKYIDKQNMYKYELVEI